MNISSTELKKIQRYIEEKWAITFDVMAKPFSMGNLGTLEARFDVQKAGKTQHGVLRVHLFNNRYTQKFGFSHVYFEKSTKWQEAVNLEDGKAIAASKYTEWESAKKELLSEVHKKNPIDVRQSNEQIREQFKHRQLIKDRSLVSQCDVMKDWDFVEPCEDVTYSPMKKELYIPWYGVSEGKLWKQTYQRVFVEPSGKRKRLNAKGFPTHGAFRCCNLNGAIEPDKTTRNLVFILEGYSSASAFSVFMGMANVYAVMDKPTFVSGCTAIVDYHKKKYPQHVFQFIAIPDNDKKREIALECELDDLGVDVLRIDWGNFHISDFRVALTHPGIGEVRIAAKLNEAMEKLEWYEPICIGFDRMGNPRLKHPLYAEAMTVSWPRKKDDEGLERWYAKRVFSRIYPISFLRFKLAQHGLNPEELDSYYELKHLFEPQLKNKGAAQSRFGYGIFTRKDYAVARFQNGLSVICERGKNPVTNVAPQCMQMMDREFGPIGARKTNSDMGFAPKDFLLDTHKEALGLEASKERAERIWGINAKGANFDWLAQAMALELFCFTDSLFFRPLLLIYGPSGGGKTFFMDYILSYLGDRQQGIVLSAKAVSAAGLASSVTDVQRNLSHRPIALFDDIDAIPDEKGGGVGKANAALGETHRNNSIGNIQPIVKGSANQEAVFMEVASSFLITSCDATPRTMSQADHIIGRRVELEYRWLDDQLRDLYEQIHPYSHGEGEKAKAELEGLSGAFIRNAIRNIFDIRELAEYLYEDFLVKQSDYKYDEGGLTHKYTSDSGTTSQKKRSHAVLLACLVAIRHMQKGTGRVIVRDKKISDRLEETLGETWMDWRFLFDRDLNDMLGVSEDGASMHEEIGEILIKGQLGKEYVLGRLLTNKHLEDEHKYIAGKYGIYPQVHPSGKFQGVWINHTARRNHARLRRLFRDNGLPTLFDKILRVGRKRINKDKKFKHFQRRGKNGVFIFIDTPPPITDSTPLEWESDGEGKYVRQGASQYKE